MRAIGLVLLAAVVGGCAHRPPSPALATASLADFVEVRCGLDQREVSFGWSGSVHALLPDQPARHLFDVVGVNVARCIPQPDGWAFTSRELMLYLDPATGRRLDRWVNPWTGHSVPVVHVANSPVQGVLRAAPQHQRTGELLSFSIEVFPTYPNPLANDPATRRFSPTPMYRASEAFTFTLDARRPSQVALVWHRQGPFLPWMDMGDQDGVLVYHAHGARHRSPDELAPELRDELARTPRFVHAPPCVLDAPNQTSWTYFRQHLADYLAGARFPVAPPPDGPCQPTARTPP